MVVKHVALTSVGLNIVVGPTGSYAGTLKALHIICRLNDAGLATESEAEPKEEQAREES